MKWMNTLIDIAISSKYFIVKKPRKWKMTLENDFVRYGIIDLVLTQNFPKMLRVHIRRLQILVFLKIVRTCQIDDG